MQLIVGLGNPGQDYEKTRHNLGFMVLGEMFALVRQKKFRCLSARPTAETVIALPQTFMNDSGQSVASLMRFYRLAHDSLWVIHDDIDLPLGAIKVQFNRSSAGHRGVQSIIDSLGSQAFHRFRLGVAGAGRKKIEVEKYVLQSFKKTEKKLVEEMLIRTRLAITLGMEQGLVAAKEYLAKNRRSSPDKKTKSTPNGLDE